MNEKNDRGIEITGYNDYVSYLTDLVAWKRGHGAFSFRNFCRKSGFRSPTYLKWVLDGVRPISPKSAHKFAAGLALDRHETEYFLLMVRYQSASDPGTKRSTYEEMLKRRQRHAGPLTKDAYEYLSHWYYVAIRELVATDDFREDPRWIRERLGGDLTLWEVKGALETLERLKLVSRDAKRRLRQTTRDLLTENEVSSLAAYNYHAEMLEIAQRVLATSSAKVRDFQSLVALIDGETFRELKREVEKFQNRIINYLGEKERVNGKKRTARELYAVNIQLLPLVPNKREES